MVVNNTANPRAWTAASVDAPHRWHQQLDRELLANLRALVAVQPGERPVTDIRLNADQREAWSESLAPALRDLETGRGFVVLDRLPLARVSQREAIALYWLIGQLLGDPFQQNVEGTLLYDVRDTGQDVAAGARFSVTSYESSFHTDNSFGDSVLDYVGLLCLKTAKSGGISQNVSGYAALDVLKREHPDVLEILSQPLHVDRRGGVKKGESATVLRPIVAGSGSELILRYLRYWIEAGHEKAGQPLTAKQRRALDVLDEVLKRAELRVEFSLEPGQMYFINNRWILHNRTAFVDHAELEQRRHLVRLWLTRRGEGRRD
jgi:alpha-ketoglutarate-dependent taurine dioxygenase